MGARGTSNVPVLTTPPDKPLAPARPRLLHVSRTSSNGGFPCRTLACAHPDVCGALETTFPSAGVRKVISGAQGWRLFGPHRPLLGPGGAVIIVCIYEMRHRERQWGQHRGVYVPCGGGVKRYIGLPENAEFGGLKRKPRSTPRAYRAFLEGSLLCCWCYERDVRRASASCHRFGGCVRVGSGDCGE